jgi:flagellar operon protein
MKARDIAARVGSSSVVKPDAIRHRQPAPPDTAHHTFADALKQARGPSYDPAPAIKLSAHAEKRIAQRDISLSRPERHDLAHALRKLDAKGAQDALLLRPDAAFVVNVPERTVVTAINQSELEDRIFTQIDSAMLV